MSNLMQTAMPKPISKVLLVMPEAGLRRALQKALQQAAKSLDNPFGIQFIGCDSAEEALAIAKGDGDLQTVLVDAGAHDSLGAEDLVQTLYALRPELDLYVLVEQNRDEAVVALMNREAIDGYFIRDEFDARGWFRIIQAELREKSHMPFFEALNEYVLMAKDAWHTPGHSSGDSLRHSPWAWEFHEFLGDQVLRADLSVSVDMLDSLLEPKVWWQKRKKKQHWPLVPNRRFLPPTAHRRRIRLFFKPYLRPATSCC